MKERDRTLGEILNTLREGYNPNYQDMAVLEAVRGWEVIEGLPHIGTDEEVPKRESVQEEETLEEGGSSTRTWATRLGEPKEIRDRPSGEQNSRLTNDRTLTQIYLGG